MPTVSCSSCDLRLVVEGHVPEDALVTCIACQKRLIDHDVFLAMPEIDYHKSQLQSFGLKNQGEPEANITFRLENDG